MIRQLQAFFTGLLINIQFFTTVPIRKELPMDRFRLKYTLHTLPLLGLLQGAVYTGIIFLLNQYASLSDLMLALILWLLMILLTGGIHLDGLIDTGDAYFSYKDIRDRLDIMQDPRVGAFGVLIVVVFLFVRFIVIYELLTMIGPGTYLFITLIPFFGKMYTAVSLQLLSPARSEGLAVFFQKGRSKYFWIYNVVYLLVIGLLIGLCHLSLLPGYVLLIIVMIIVSLLFTAQINKHFGGITGDILGASYEGMELLLWITLYLLHYFAMV